MWRTSARILAVLLAAASFAGADEAACLAAVKDLEAKVAAESQATWDERYESYKAAKAALAEAESDACDAAYEAITKQVADGLRRESVPMSGWLMGLFGAALLWGGMTVCIVIAMKSGQSGTDQD